MFNAYVEETAARLAAGDDRGDLSLDAFVRDRAPWKVRR